MALALLSCCCYKDAVLSVLALFQYCLPVFDEICGTEINFVLYVRVTLIKIAKSAALVLSVIH